MMGESYVIAGPVFYGVLAALVGAIALVLLFVFAVAAASGRADRDAGVKGSARAPSPVELDEIERQGRHERLNPYVADLRRLSDVELASVGEDVISGMERLEGQGRATSSLYAQLAQQAGHVLDEQRRRRHKSHR